MQENKLADGREFNFWEKEVNYVRTLYVACDAVNASNDNDGSIDAPFKSIQAAADIAEPGTVIIKASEEIHDFEKSEGWRLWGYGVVLVTIITVKLIEFRRLF